MKKGALPKGPIGFRVYGIGKVDGNPTVHAEVRCGIVYEVMEFNRRLGKWFLDKSRTEKVPLNEEEQQMLEEVWAGECKKFNFGEMK